MGVTRTNSTMTKIAAIAFALFATVAARPDSFESREAYRYRAPVFRAPVVAARPDSFESREAYRYKAPVVAARPDSIESREAYRYRAPASSASSEESYESSEAHYNFQWAVSDESSENHFGHQEARDGYDTQGSYYVQL